MRNAHYASDDEYLAAVADALAVAPDVVWEKLKSLRAGADLATRRLFGG